MPRFKPAPHTDVRHNRTRSLVSVGEWQLAPNRGPGASPPALALGWWPGGYWPVAGWAIGGLISGAAIDKTLLDAGWRKLERPGQGAWQGRRRQPPGASWAR